MAGRTKKLDDKALIDLIKTKKDQMAYGTLLEKYRKSLYFTILKMVNNRDDAEDLTMQAFTKAFKNLDNYDLNYAFSTWLFKIATNNTIDFIRKKRLQTTSLDRGMNDDDENGGTFGQMIKDDKLDPEETMVRQQRNKLMLSVVEKLDDKYRELIQLRYYDELKYEEISKKLDLPVGTVKVRLSRAKALLAGILSGHEEKF